MNPNELDTKERHPVAGQIVRYIHHDGSGHPAVIVRGTGPHFDLHVLQPTHHRITQSAAGEGNTFQTFEQFEEAEAKRIATEKAEAERIAAEEKAKKIEADRLAQEKLKREDEEEKKKNMKTPANIPTKNAAVLTPKQTAPKPTKKGKGAKS